MPVYVYRCSNCGANVERYQHFTDDPLTVCPKCGEVALRKVYEPTAFVLKGRGWYNTDKTDTRG